MQVRGIMFDDYIEVITQGVLNSLNDGVHLMKIEVDCSKVNSLVSVVLAMLYMNTFASTRNNARFVNGKIGEVNSLEDFIHYLGYSQLYAFLELNAHIDPIGLDFDGPLD